MLASSTATAQQGTERIIHWYDGDKGENDASDRIGGDAPEHTRTYQRSEVPPVSPRSEQVAPDRRKAGVDPVTKSSVPSIGDPLPAKPEPPVTKLPAEPFEGAFIDGSRNGIPFYKEIIPLQQGTMAFSAFILDAEYVRCTPEEIGKWGSDERIGQEPEVFTHVGMYRKQPQGMISIYPFRRNSTNGQLEKLVKFRLELAQTKGSGAGMPKSYPAQSKLASGDWFRFTVTKDGLHRITHSFLQELGVDMQGLQSDQINIYGNHFGQLPYQNNIDRPTDLVLNAIQVNDGGDGNFGPGDEILFFASNAHRWDLVDGRFVHTKHAYSDSASYFIGIGIDPPKRVSAASLTTADPTRTVTRFNDRQFIEKDVINLMKSGRTWFGDIFDLVTTYNYNFEVPYLVPDEELTLEFTGTSRTLGISNSSTFNVSSGGSFNTSFSITGVSGSYTNAQSKPFDQSFNFNAAGNNLPVTVTFVKHDPITSVGWMDYLRLNCRRDLRMFGDQLIFRDLESVGAGEVSEFSIDLAQNVDQIWEITDPTDVRRVEFTAEGGQKKFRVSTDSLRQFIAFRNAGYLTPVKVGRVPNQNLHSTPLGMDLVMVVPVEFTSAAQRLAERRMSEGLSVIMVTPQQIYNEFSSGSRDATAIKRYMRMLYEKAGEDPELLPDHLLLFGDGSYNNWNWSPGNQGYIPSYQTKESIVPRDCYTSDDYFGLLDDNEGEWTGDLVDIGIGRLPVNSLTMANEVVSKILNHDRLQMLTATGDVCSTTGDGGLVDWRTQVLFTSDDQQGDGLENIIHMNQSDILARRVEQEHPHLNVNKIYLDAYQQISTPGGQRYPQAATELSERVQKGSLLVNYIGHGGEVGWAHERLLDNNTILGWTNSDRLPIFMTATCEFSRWDDPARTSAGEYVLINPSGGAVALMSTTRLAYSGENFALGQKFFDHVFDQDPISGLPLTLGDIYRETKRDIATASPDVSNHRNFSLLGDPSQRLAMPRQTVKITAITDTLGSPIDTLKALSTVRITGFIDDGNGQPMADFNGQVIPMVYDKEQTVVTLQNDNAPSPFVFKIRKNIIYRGKASVTNGQFSFTFVVPKDINYQFGAGRVACYAESWTTNAAGFNNDVIVGGAATDVAMDEIGPKIELFLNDENFVRGGITDESPLLVAKIFDDNGVNTVGTSIGHDLLATLDENTEQPIVLNDLYEADLDTYKSGTVRYRLSGLAEGEHKLHLKAWDVFNNSAESTTEFVVAPSAELALAHVLNYPNPFTTFTQFFFEHNRPCTTLDVQVQVFTVSGRLVKTIGSQLACNGYRSDPLPWDGRDDHGDKLGRGVYVYRLNVSTPEGEKAEKFEKLVILR